MRPIDPNDEVERAARGIADVVHDEKQRRIERGTAWGIVIGLLWFVAIASVAVLLIARWM